MSPKLKKLIKPVANKVLRPTLGWMNRTVGHAVMPDGRVYSTPQSLSALSYLSMFLGQYEVAERTILRTHFRDANTIVEIGSNIGVVSRVALEEKLVDGGKIICVEPNPDSHDVLIKNLERGVASARRGGKTIHLNVEFSAISAPGHIGQALFIPRNNLSSGLVGQVETSHADKDHVRVPITCLSRLLHDHNISGGYSLICDAEGAEIPMIFKDAAALERCEQMAIELHEPSLTGSDVTPRDMVDELERQGFRLIDRQLHTYYLSRVAI